jgi:hypothetical protein
MRINQIWNKAYELNKFESQITQIIQVSNTMATKLDSSFQVPQMLDQIILQLLMSVGVSKFLTLGQESGKAPDDQHLQEDPGDGMVKCRTLGSPTRSR